MGYKLNDDTFETNLKLVNNNGDYNVMAELLSDNNRYSLIFVKFSGINKASIPNEVIMEISLLYLALNK